MRMTSILSREWRFRRGDQPGAERNPYDDSGWETVRLPHDWAVAGPFSPDNDFQIASIKQDGIFEEIMHYGRTGALPHAGVGFYRLELELPSGCDDRAVRLEFDGIMSHSTIWVNGRKAGGRPAGYTSFAIDATGLMRYGEKNLIAVRVENPPAASRWYPGAGIYREVRMVILEKSHFNYQGVRLEATVDDPDDHHGKIRVSVSHTGTARARLRVTVSAPDGTCAGSLECAPSGGEIELESVTLWSPAEPRLYRVEVELLEDGTVADRVELSCGFRHVRFDATSGMFLNGKMFRMNGVCLHHDLGPFGAAFQRAELRRRFLLLKSIGCNALRTSHNPPAPEFLDLADEIGFVVIDEAFDCWTAGKVPNDYSRSYPEWHRRDLADMIRRDRHHPSIIMWSIGNEINEQGMPCGAAVARELAALCRELDPSRPVTAGLDRPDEAFANGLPQELDIAGWNYKPARYAEFHAKLPQTPQYGSETASTFSSRGWYDFPFQAGQVLRENRQCSGCDLEHPSYATTPDFEFEQQDASPWIMGEFVWTGFDYLGEPSPYHSCWPARSSYYGIFDLAGMPKDRAFLYKARWVKEEKVLHLLPHWTWPGHEGESLVVHVYTNYDRVELFLNGNSLGVRERHSGWRLIWENVPYRPGKLEAAALDSAGSRMETAVMRTASEPAQLRLSADRRVFSADGEDLICVEVEAMDRHGVPHPTAALSVRFRAEGAGELAALCNGDATSLEPFTGNSMRLFSGKCAAFLRAGERPGILTLTAETPGLPPATLTVLAEDGMVSLPALCVG